MMLQHRTRSRRIQLRSRTRRTSLSPRLMLTLTTQLITPINTHLLIHRIH